MRRRNFLQASGMAVGTVGVIPRLIAAAEDSPVPQHEGAGIAELQLQTRRIDKLHKFYGMVLGLPTQRDSRQLTITAGSTRIVFSSVDEGEPFYHFAFNIPENKLEAARQWQKQRTKLVRKGKSEVVHFSKWNAHSVFFRDPAGNLLEYIARHDLDNSAKGVFSPADILYASEIGLVVDDVSKTVAAARTELHLDIYRDNSANFASIGDEHSLLVVVKRDRKWFPARQRPAKVFPLAATIRKPTAAQLAMEQYGYKVSTQ